MRGLLMMAGLLVLLAMACTQQPEPTSEPIEVTRIVAQEIEVEKPVTRIVDREIEIPVTVEVEIPVTVEVEIPVTVEVEIPVTVEVTRIVVATPSPEPTPNATATPRPEPTPTVDLANAERGNLFIAFLNDGDKLVVRADPPFDVDEFDLDVFVDGKEYCNSARIYADDDYRDLSCELEYRSHTSVSNVSAQTSLGDLRCGKRHSESDFTLFLCVWR